MDLFILVAAINGIYEISQLPLRHIFFNEIYVPDFFLHIPYIEQVGEFVEVFSCEDFICPVRISQRVFKEFV